MLIATKGTNYTHKEAHQSTFGIKEIILPLRVAERFISWHW
jgi:hypothetical protein